MNDFTTLLAFGLPPPELAKDLLRSMQTPALATLLGFAKQTPLQSASEFARILPHEQFFIQHGIDAGLSSLPATACMRAVGHMPSAGHWFLLNPVHIHIARDHLILTDQRQLPLSESESRALFDAAEPYFAESHIQIVYGDACNWFARIDAWAELDCASLDAACGHNIDIWLPKQAASPHERQWRKLQNEIQMLWYAHPVNEARQEQGLPPVNALWLWAGSNAQTSLAAAKPIQQINVGQQATLGTPHQSSLHLLCQPAQAVSEMAAGSLLYLDQLSAPALASDWGDWLQQLHALEAHCFAPLLAKLKAGQIAQVHLVLSDSLQLTQFSTSRFSLNKFWRKPSLQALVRPCPASPSNKVSA